MDGKIKFGFSKVIKKANLVNLNGENEPKAVKIEMIEAIEGSSIKITGFVDNFLYFFIEIHEITFLVKILKMN